MPFRASFACLWCGTAHTTRTPDDLEGWSQLCPACLGKAGENNFLRARLRQGLAERSAAAGPVAAAVAVAEAVPGPADEARVGTDDDWYLRRGRHARGAIHDAAWHAELDMAGRWLDAEPFAGELVELAAGSGWWSPLLAAKGELSLYDTSPAALDRARERLVAHGLRAHIHERDPWAEPDRRVAGVFTGFWLRHVERERLAAFLELVGRWLQPGGRFAFLDALPDALSGATSGADGGPGPEAPGAPGAPAATQRTADELAQALRTAGFDDVQVGTTGRFFVHGSGRRPEAV